MHTRLEASGGAVWYMDAWSGEAGPWILGASVDDIPCVLLLRSGKLINKLTRADVLGRNYNKYIQGWA